MKFYKYLFDREKSGLYIITFILLITNFLRHLIDPKNGVSYVSIKIPWVEIWEFKVSLFSVAFY